MYINMYSKKWKNIIMNIVFFSEDGHEKIKMDTFVRYTFFRL